MASSTGTLLNRPLTPTYSLAPGISRAAVFDDVAIGADGVARSAYAAEAAAAADAIMPFADAFDAEAAADAIMPSVQSLLPYVPTPYQPGWEIWVGFAAGIIPFAIGAAEFGKRILIQQRCEVCGGKGLVASAGPGGDK